MCGKITKQDIWRERLLKVSPGRPASFADAMQVKITRHDDDIAMRRDLEQGVGELEAVHGRHLKIRDEVRGRLEVRSLERLARVPEWSHVEPRL